MNIEEQYLDLLQQVSEQGQKKEGRNGFTRSQFGVTLRHDMAKGFPLLTTKHISLKNIATELFWFLSGSTNIRPLIEANNYIWVGDCYKKYCDGDTLPLTRDEFIDLMRTNDSFANHWGDVGPGYGFQWRDFNGSGDGVYHGQDQVANLMNMLNNTPDSRRMLVSAWNPNQVDDTVLPPCHVLYQLYTRDISYNEAIGRFPWGSPVRQDFIADDFPKKAVSLMWYQRSADVPLGVPYNIASYGLLLSLIAKTLDMIPDQLIGVFGDTHIYDNQLDLVPMQLHRKPFALPTLSIENKRESLFDYTYADLTLNNYKAQPRIDYPLSN